MAKKPATTETTDAPLTDLRRHGYARIWPQLANQLIASGWPDSDVKLAQTAYSASVAMFGDLVRANEAPFLSHTVGTASILAFHGAPPLVVCGGLLHAAYTHGQFATPLDKPLMRAHRLSLARQIGADAEQLVRNYRRYRPELIPVPNSAAEYEEEHAAVLLIRAANHLEEYLDFGLLYANKTQKQAEDVMRHARMLLPSLGYDRLLAELETAERLMTEAKPVVTVDAPAGTRSRAAGR